MAKLTIIAAAVFIAFAATSHNAKANGFESGYQLGGDCLAGFGNGSMTNDSYAKGGMCVGYITGTMDALGGTAFCIPSDIKVARLAQKVTNYMSEQTEADLKKYSGAVFVKNALARAYPCH